MSERTQTSTDGAKFVSSRTQRNSRRHAWPRYKRESIHRRYSARHTVWRCDQPTYHEYAAALERDRQVVK